MELGLKGKTVVVTGATGGLGQAFSRAFAREGARVAVCYGSKKEIAVALADEIANMGDVREAGGMALPFQVDVTCPQSVNSMVNAVREAFGGIDILVNNAGSIHKRQSLLTLSLSDWQSAFNTSANGTFLCTQAAVPYMIKGAFGRVINISSAHAVAGGRQGLGGYASAKGSVVSFTKTAAKEFGPFGITVNAIVPGFIDAGMSLGLTDETKDAIRAQCPAGRLGEADEIAALGVFLASVQAGYINGQAIRCDGGRFDYSL